MLLLLKLLKLQLHLTHSTQKGTLRGNLIPGKDGQTISEPIVSRASAVFKAKKWHNGQSLLQLQQIKDFSFIYVVAFGSLPGRVKTVLILKFGVVQIQTTK